MPNFKSFWALFAPLACLSIELCVALPFLVFVRNQNEFTLGFFDLVAPAAIPALMAIFALPLLAGLLPERFARSLATIFLGIAVLIYAQANILNGNYGQFDGQDIKWSEFRGLLYADLALWVIGALAIAYFRERLFLLRTQLSLALPLLFFISAIPQIPETGVRWRSQPADTTGTFEFSPQRNAIIIVLDAFASPAFDLLVNKEPALAESFRGFTFYRNTVAGFPTTSPSIPEILSGQLYGNDMPFSAFLEKALRNDSLPSLLAQNGFQVDLVTLQHYCFHLKSSSCLTLGDLGRSDQKALARTELATLLDTSLFRATPQPIKRLIYNQQDWLLQSWLAINSGPRHQVDSVRLVSQLEREAKLNQSTATFKFIHLLLPHAPIRTNAQCEFLPPTAPSAQRNYLGQARCALSLVERIFAALKKLGVYDSSLIMVLADHGAQAGFKQLPRSKDYARLVKALPLLLVKPAGSASEPLQTSLAPAHLIDVANSMASALTIQHSFPGRDIRTLSPGEARQRHFNYYSWKDHMWSGESLPPITRYSTNSDAWDLNAWQLNTTP